MAYVLSLLALLLFWPLSYVTDIWSFFWPDSIFFIAILSLLFFLRNKLNLSLPVYIFVTLGFLTHSLGTVGWYGESPIALQWDHITHFFGIFGWSMLLFRAFEKNFTKFMSWKNVGIFLTLFLATQGMGALVELTEFVGFLKFGFGDGALMFGTGDSQADGFNMDTAINWVGGGWINTGWDLVFNFIGAIFGLVLSVLYHVWVNRSHRVVRRY